MKNVMRVSIAVLFVTSGVTAEVPGLGLWNAAELNPGNEDAAGEYAALAPALGLLPLGSPGGPGEAATPAAINGAAVSSRVGAAGDRRAAR